MPVVPARRLVLLIRLNKNQSILNLVVLRLPGLDQFEAVGSFNRAKLALYDSRPRLRPLDGVLRLSFFLTPPHFCQSQNEVADEISGSTMMERERVRT